MRIFVAVDMPEFVKIEVVKIQRNLPEFIGKFIEKENLHLTLKFLGEVDEESVEEIKKRLAGIKFNKLNLVVDNLGIFSTKFVRIVWLHIFGAEELQKKIDEALIDLFSKEVRFMSHLTIARVKSVKDRNKFLEAISGIKIPRLEFVCDSFELKKSVLKSNGPVYETLEKYN